MAPKMNILTFANEAAYIRQRSRFHLPTKPIVFFGVTDSLRKCSMLSSRRAMVVQVLSLSWVFQERVLV